MESLSRPPHRRKHSSSANAFSSSFSFKNPYEDIFLSSGGSKKPFGANDYADIFSGSSSIPILDLSGLDERVGSDENRTASKLDYSNIFGGVGNEDVAVPYEELFSRPAKKTEQRVPADVRSPSQEPVSLQSSEKTGRASGEVSDQFADGFKNQFNLSFNKTSQRNIDALNGKTHIAQIHAVPGFTYFVDGTSHLQKPDGRPVRSLKEEVSRTWSFNAPVDGVKSKGGSSPEKSQLPDALSEVNEVRSKMPPPQTRISGLDHHKDLKQSKPYSFVQKQDDSEKKTGANSPTFLEEEIDENSAAGLSAAALKRAIDQAEESIRLAKMIMKRKQEGFRDGNKPKSKGRSKVRDKMETRTDLKPSGSWEDSDKDKYERSDPLFSTATERNFAPSTGNGKTCSNVGKALEERVRDNVEAAKDHGTSLTGAGEILARSWLRGEPLHDVAKTDMEEPREVVQTTEVHKDATNFPGLVAHREYRTANFKPVKVEENNTSIPFTNKHISNCEVMEINKEILEPTELNIHRVKEPEVVADVENGTPQGIQESEKGMDDAPEECYGTRKHENNPEKLETVPNTSQASLEQCVLDENSETLSVFLLNEFTKQRESVSDDKKKHNWKSEKPTEVKVENLTLMKSVFDDLRTGAQILVEKEDQEVLKAKSDNIQGLGKLEDGECNGMSRKEAPAASCFESEVQLEEALEKDSNGMKPEVIPLIREFNYEVTNDEEEKHIHEGDEQNVPAENDHNGIGVRHINGSENETAEAVDMETANRAESQTQRVVRGTDGAETGTEDQSKCELLEREDKQNIDDDVDADIKYSGTVVTETHSNDAVVFGEPQETSGADLKNNRAEEFHKAPDSYFEDIRVPVDCEAYSAIGKEKIEKIFDVENDEIPETHYLHRSASEDAFLGIRLPSVCKDFSMDDEKLNTGIMDANDGENLPKHVFGLESDFEIPDAGLGCAAKIRDDPSNIEKVEIGLTNIREISEQTPEIDQASISSSTAESMDGLSSDESQQFAETSDDQVPLNNEELKDDTNGLSSDESQQFAETSDDRVPLNKDELKDDINGLSSDESQQFTETSDDQVPLIKDELKEDIKTPPEERGFAEEQNEAAHPKDQSETMYSEVHNVPENMDKSVETGRVAQTSESMEEKGNLTENSTMEEKNTKQSASNFDKNDRIEAIKRGREREKDRIVVERAIREARERAFAEARERAERAAVEKAAAEVRQRMLAEAREKLEKGSMTSKQQSDKQAASSAEARLRAERAAVERATAEARERALEKARSQKTSTEARLAGERHPSDRVSSSSRNNGLKHSFSSSDLEKFDGANTESAQRRKARLERHQRIMERAAKALEEKNMRDLRAQKEQAERNRLAESLDLDIKRWATGKEGNLRALLSTLQYILGPDSGWQPISLTEIITTAAVKKAYRKATLYVHPDKLQQRGASIQQKYVCEKVFDLLKAAWNRFNSEER